MSWSLSIGLLVVDHLVDVDDVVVIAVGVAPRSPAAAGGGGRAPPPCGPGRRRCRSRSTVGQEDEEQLRVEQGAEEGDVHGPVHDLGRRPLGHGAEGQPGADDREHQAEREREVGLAVGLLAVRGPVLDRRRPPRSAVASGFSCTTSQALRVHSPTIAPALAIGSPRGIDRDGDQQRADDGGRDAGEEPRQRGSVARAGWSPPVRSRRCGSPARWRSPRGAARTAIHRRELVAGALRPRPCRRAPHPAAALTRRASRAARWRWFWVWRRCLDGCRFVDMVSDVTRRPPRSRRRPGQQPLRAPPPRDDGLDRWPELRDGTRWPPRSRATARPSLPAQERLGVPARGQVHLIGEDEQRRLEAATGVPRVLVEQQRRRRLSSTTASSRRSAAVRRVGLPGGPLGDQGEQLGPQPSGHHRDLAGDQLHADARVRRPRRR